jgi:hypothetical protein
MSATIYKLPTADDFGRVEDLTATVASYLDEIVSDLKRPFDGDRETEAEPVTLAYAGHAFLFARFLRFYANNLGKMAGQIEDAVAELREAQEEDGSRVGLGEETWLEYATRRARQWREAADEAERVLTRGERREAGDGS